MSKISLNEFARERNVNPGTVHRKCRELGITTADGLTNGAIAALDAHFPLPTKPQTPTTDDEPVKPGSIILHQGRSLPTLPGQFQAPDLEIDLGDFYDLQDRGAKLADASAQQLGSFLSRYAAHRVKQSIARIDAEISAIEGQALNQAVGKLAG